MASDADGTDGTDDLAYIADRSCGILTPSDHRFLLGRRTDYTDHSKKQRQNRIRQRLHNAILDFAILFESLEDRGRETVFNPDVADREAYTRGITDILAFLHLGTMGYCTPFKNTLVRGVSKAEQELTDSDYRVVTVDFNAKPVGQIDVDAVIDKLERGAFDQPAGEELQVFVRPLARSDDFSATDLRAGIKIQMSELVKRIDTVNERRDHRVDDLNG